MLTFAVGGGRDVGAALEAACALCGATSCFGEETARPRSAVLLWFGLRWREAMGRWFTGRLVGRVFSALYRPEAAKRKAQREVVWRARADHASCIELKRPRRLAIPKEATL